MNAVQDVDLRGQTIGRYVILALIGAGGQGRVYRGRDQRLPREVAVKVIGADRPPDPAGRRALVLEARALSLLNHPHVAGIYDFVTQGGRDFMVMEFVAGATLRDIVTGGPLPPSEVLRLGSQLARGLAAAHAANLVHCDIKPANIKITSSGELKILDFGLARLLPSGTILDNASRTPNDDAVVGTVPYMAPEQLRGSTPDHRMDIFSAGAVLYEMATGCPAFPQRTLGALVEAVQRVDPLPPSAVNPLVPLALETIIITALQKDARARQQSAMELGASLEALTPSGRPDPAGVPSSAGWSALARAGR